ncbi:hypothetical protein FQZ97_573600 [compost metagenome]
MPHVDFDGIKSRVTYQAGCRSVLGNGAADIGAVHGTAEGKAGEQPVLVDADAGAAWPRDVARAIAAEIAAVGKLGRDGAPFGMHRCGQALQLREDAGVHPHLVGEGQAIRGDTAIGHRGQTDTAPRHGGVMADQVVARNPARAHAFEGGGLDQAVAQLKAGQASRLQQGIQLRAHAGSRASKGTNSATSSSKPDTAL